MIMICNSTWCRIELRRIRYQTDCILLLSSASLFTIFENDYIAKLSYLLFGLLNLKSLELDMHRFEPWDLADVRFTVCMNSPGRDFSAYTFSTCMILHAWQARDHYTV